MVSLPSADPQPGPRTRVLLLASLLLTVAALSGPASARPVAGDGGPGDGTGTRTGETWSGGAGAGLTWPESAAARPTAVDPVQPTETTETREITEPAGVWPLRPEPTVVRRFDPPLQRWTAGHRGVDLLGRPGQRVRAAAAGTVTFAGRIAGRGVVVVGHGDTRTTYEPLSASVSAGQQVGPGDVVGRLELLASHCLPRACLHWGLLRGETYLDPLTLVGRGPVRLVPWSGLTSAQARGWAWR